MMANIKNKQTTKRENNKHWQGCEEIGTLFTTGRNVRWLTTTENNKELPQQINRITI